MTPAGTATSEGIEAPVTRPLVELPSGVALRIENINFIARMDLGKFAVHFHATPGLPNNYTSPIITTADMDVLREFGIIQRIQASEKDAQPAAANDAPKIELAT